MKNEEISLSGKLWILFSSTFLISASTNGGFAILSMMRRNFVEKYHWLEEDEMLDLMSIAQSTPGPIAINTSVLAGYRVAGLAGALTTLLATVLPPLIIMSIVCRCYAFVADNRYVRYFMNGMQAAVGALLVDVSIDMFVKASAKKSILSYVIMAVTFILVRYVGLNVFFIAIGAALCGLIKVLVLEKKVSQ